MRVEGHAAPFRFLLGAAIGSPTGSDTYTLDPLSQGVITDISLTLQIDNGSATISIGPASGGPFIIAGAGAAGFTPEYAVTYLQRGLFIPVYAGETIGFDFAGGVDSARVDYAVSGYLYSVQATS